MSSTHGVPAEDACCLATMEDITIEDGNYVEYQVHPGMMWYPSLYEKSVIENLLQTQFGNYIEKVKKTDCQAELRRLLATGPPIYISDPHALPLPPTTTSAAAAGGGGGGGGQEDGGGGGGGSTDGPTATVVDDTHICAIWYADGSNDGAGTQVSAKLIGAVEGDEREKLWDELKQFLVVDGTGDDD